MDRLFVKYLAPLLAITIIPLLLSGLFLYFLISSDFEKLETQLTHQISQELTREISFKNEAIAQTEGMFVEQEIDRIGNKMSAMALSPDFLQMDKYHINQYVENLLSSEPAILEVTVVDKFGDVMYNKVSSFSLLSEEYIDVAEREIFRTLERKESYVSDVQISSRTQLPYITMGQPIIQFAGNFEGGIILNLNLNFIWNIVVGKQVGEQGLLFIVSDDGQLISHPSKKELYQNGDYAKYEHIQTIIKEKNGTLLEGKNLLSFYTNKYNWTTIIQIPQEQALKSVEKNRATIQFFISNSLGSISLATGVLMLILLVFVSLVSVYVTRRIINPILELTAATKTVAEGNLNMSLAKRSNDEIGQLTDSFNTMTEQLRLQREELLKNNEFIKEQAEVLLDRYNSDLEQFAYVTTHDLIEPLRMITSYTQLLQRRNKEVFDHGEGQEFMTYIVEGVKRMHIIINDLFEYSHIRTNVKDFELVDCMEVFEFVVDRLSKEIRESDGRIVCAGLPKTKAVYSNMVQLFQNLLINAMKFRKPGEPSIIEVTYVDMGADWQFSFKDNGIGIDPAYKDKVFEIFKRLNKRDAYSGSGMGLAICKNIVERHGGKIWVESQLGVGATFHFTIKKY